MREIKFRQWNPLTNEMQQFTDRTDIEVLKDGTVRAYWPKNILMQYTGIKDKNGKEIYEGDVVKHRKLDRSGDIIMYGLAEVFMDKPQVVRYEGCGFVPLAGWVDIAVEDFEWQVIGNIHETPELLTT